jgi:hypothetical protein
MMYLFVLLPVVLAFVVLWWLDAFLEQKIQNGAVVAAVEIVIVLMILILSLFLFVYNFT